MVIKNQILTLSLCLSLASSIGFAFDSSDYRQNTYGPPNHYCNPTRPLSSNGSGTLADPWNMTQCARLPVPGDVIGVMPGVSVPIPVSGSIRIPAFEVINSGTATNRIIFVTRYAAVALPNVATNPNRTELRHNGTAPHVSADGNDDTGTGCPIIGAYFKNYITFDGFFIDMAQAYPKTDSGVIRIEEATGIHLRNFEIKGTTTNMQSNPIIYRPQNGTNTILSNFRVYDFQNDPTGSRVPQGAFFSDQYGDQNFLIENFEIRNTGHGIFLKGSAGTSLNYGRIRNGIVSNISSCFQFHALDATHVTTLEYNICQDVTSVTGIFISSEIAPARNLLIHHNTVARVGNSNTNGAIYSRSAGFTAGNNNVEIRDNLFDINNGPSTNAVDYGEIPSLPQLMNYNAYYKNGATLSWAWNGVGYNSINTWRTATGLDANSRVLTTSPFIDRANGNFQIVAGHEAKTASSTGGELGAYASTQVIGVDLTDGGPPPPSATSPRAPSNLRIL